MHVHGREGSNLSLAVLDLDSLTLAFLPVLPVHTGPDRAVFLFLVSLAIAWAYLSVRKPLDVLVGVRDLSVLEQLYG